MKRYSCYICDDWNTVIAFKGEPDFFKQIVDFVEDILNAKTGDILTCDINKEDFRHIQGSLEVADVILCMINWDRCYWELICSSDKYIELVKKSLKEKDIPEPEGI